MSMPIVSLTLCRYDRERRVLTLTSDHIGMPQQFIVNSPTTGKDVRFVAVGPYDILFDQDQWDGEQQVYRPMGDVPSVDHMVIYHG